MDALRERPSHLFTLRLWEQQLERGESEIRFKVQHILSGEVRYFRDWSEVLAFCAGKLRPGQGA